ncbi:Putative cytosolic protein (plasmid) [Borrelia anserina BA2]|uniref:Putative membrane protein insertion efficiency factor n=3 Tax=Borrelia anserina TaxID=143 RepID=W5SSU3_BORAN|nr:Putative cytosolic protein [Borrelia anserina BA2]AHH08887.1 Putative cytosolic protein [Borrelia anserina BA2]
MYILQKILMISNLIFVLLIKIYQSTFSKIIGPCCLYKPNCSNYALKCLKKYNIMIAFILITLRLVRCNALFKGGVDPIPTKKPILKSLKEFRTRLIK